MLSSSRESPGTPLLQEETRLPSALSLPLSSSIRDALGARLWLWRPLLHSACTSSDLAWPHVTGKAQKARLTWHGGLFLCRIKGHRRRRFRAGSGLVGIRPLAFSLPRRHLQRAASWLKVAARVHPSRPHSSQGRGKINTPHPLILRTCKGPTVLLIMDCWP